MKLNYLDVYLIVVNIIGFILFIINTWLYSHTAEKQIDAILTITSLIGGSAGIVLAIIIFDRKHEKGNMMSRVFVYCILTIQIVIVLYIKGIHNETVSLSIWNFFAHHLWMIVYLTIINIITIITFYIDKRNAIEKRSRIRIVTLLGLAFIGGSIGALIAMYTFRHKTRKDYFTIGVPLILIMHIILIFYLSNL